MEHKFQFQLLLLVEGKIYRWHSHSHISPPLQAGGLKVVEEGLFLVDLWWLPNKTLSSSQVSCWPDAARWPSALHHLRKPCFASRQAYQSTVVENSEIPT